MSETTLISCLTPPGKAAIAVLAVRGPAAWTVTRELFERFTTRKKSAASTAPLPETPGAGRIWLGLFGQRSRDEAVLLVRAADPEPWLELHCHGGAQVIQLIQEQYETRGVSVIPWTEFDDGAAPAWRVDAERVLAHASTARTAAIALDQWHGAFVRQMERITAAQQRGNHDEARTMLDRLVQLIPVGKHLAEPWKVVIAGAPNVGKSSLINALAGFTRCLVAPTPGTTRDVVTTTIARDGWPIELADTAGLRAAGETIEQAGMAMARQALAAADVRVWVLDGSSTPIFPDKSDGWLLLINKCDLPPAWDWATVPQALPVSALTGAGLGEAVAVLVQRLVPQVPAAGEPVPISPHDWLLLLDWQNKRGES
jgi:tRNA modification GTPase